MSVRDDIRALADEYARQFKEKIDERVDATDADDKMQAEVRHGDCLDIAHTLESAPLTPEQLKRRDDAQLLLDKLFQEGTGFLQEPRFRQYGQTRILLDKIDTNEIKVPIKAVGLEDAFALATQLHKTYGTRIDYTSTTNQSSPFDQWYEALEHYLATVLSNHGRRSALRQELLAPYQQITEAISKDRQNARKKQEAGNTSDATTTSISTSPDATTTTDTSIINPTTAPTSTNTITLTAQVPNVTSPTLSPTPTISTQATKTNTKTNTKKTRKS